MKNCHIEQFINPEKCIMAVKKLRDLGNPHFQDIEIDENFMKKNDIEDVNAVKVVNKTIPESPQGKLKFKIFKQLNLDVPRITISYNLTVLQMIAFMFHLVKDLTGMMSTYLIQ